MPLGAENTGLSLGAEAIKLPTIPEVGGSTTGLADTLEKTAAVNPHQTLEGLATEVTNSVTNAGGTEINAPPVNEATEMPAASSLTEVTNKPPEPTQPQPEQNIEQYSGVQSEGAQQQQPESTKPEAVSQQQDTSKANEPASAGSPSETGQAKAETETPNTPPKEGTDKKAETAESQQQRITELQEKIRGGTATEDELREYRDLKQKEDPEVRRKALEEKILAGNFTDEEAAEWRRLSSGDKAKGGETDQKLTETDLEQINQEIEKLGVEILRGEGDRAEKIVKLQELRDKALGLKPEMSEEKARELVNSVLNPDKSISRRTAKEIALQREIKKKLERLMALEMQVLMAPRRLEALRRQAKEIKKDIAVSEEKTKGKIDITNEKIFNERMNCYSLYMKLANIKAEIFKTKTAIPILIGEYKDTMQYVRRKLGITRGFTAFLEWADAKLNKTAIDLYVDNASLTNEE